MLAKVISKQKLIYYDAKSLKLVYLLKLAVFPHEAHIVTDLRAVKSDQRHPALYSGLPCSYRQRRCFINAHAQQLDKKLLASQLSQIHSV